VSGLYVHIPFCVRKCAYCDFYSVAGRLDLIDAYIDALLLEAQGYAGLPFKTLYLGGGTPSLLGANGIKKLIDGLNMSFDLRHLIEVTIEVNPESATGSVLGAARDSGINRVSIGVQSLCDAELVGAGRIHRAKEATDALATARRTGFSEISADTIVGLPGQDWRGLQTTLGTLTDSDISHLSLYCLSLEPGTPLAENPPPDLPSADVQAELFQQAVDFLIERGFYQYEISNFALNGHECRHNLNYWRGGEYLGLGPAAASHWRGQRRKNREELESYLDNPRGLAADLEKLEAREKAAEEAILRLRLISEGLDTNQLCRRFGEDNTSSLIFRLNALAEEGLLNASGSKYRLPPSRVLTSNPILCRLLGD
jgi:oxygen-independent coproporphyrinogen-3 oxidase